MIEWMFGDSNNKSNGTAPGSTLTGQFNFVVETSPKIPETNSNLNILCYKNKTKKNVLPVRVKWWRLKNNQLTEIVGLKGSTYPCEPADIGCKIKAQISSIEDQGAGKAEVWFGPIKIDIGLKQLLANVVYTGRTLFPVFLNKDREKEARISINQNQISITDVKTEKTFKFEYNLTEPRIEMNPKQLTRISMRFREDASEDLLKSFMGSVFEENMEKSTYSGTKSSSSRLFRNENKIELRLLSRNSRDLLLFTIKAFATKKQMKTSALFDKIERIDLDKDELLNVFFEFESIRSDVLRIDMLNKELAADRDRKTKDLRLMEEQLSTVTTTYLKIIEQKCKDKIDLNESYSQLSMVRQQIAGRNKFRQLQKENRVLKEKVRDLTQEVEVLQFFKKGNESLLHHSREATSNNPFEKKKRADQVKPMTAVEISRIHVDLINNTKIKDKEKSKIEMENLLDSLNDEDEGPAMQELRTKYNQLKERYSSILGELTTLKLTLVNTGNDNNTSRIGGIPQEPSHNDTSSLSSSMLNASMTSEAGMQLLQQKFLQLRSINDKLLAEAEKYRKQKQKYRRDIDMLSEQVRVLQAATSKGLNVSSYNHEDSGDIAKIRHENQELKTNNNQLKKRIQGILAESGKLRNTFEIQRKYEELSREHMICKDTILRLQEELHMKDERSLTESNLRMPSQSARLKEINQSLLAEINILKKQMQKLKAHPESQSTHALNLKVFSLETELSRLRAPGSNKNQSLNQALTAQLYQARQIILQLKQENQVQVQKIKQLNDTIHRLSLEIQQKMHKSVLQQSMNSSQLNSTVTPASLEKYKRRIRELESELDIVRKSSQALNRSRDLSMDLEQYNAETIERLSTELEELLKENQKLSEMCEKYSKQAREATKLRAQNQQLRTQLDKHNFQL